jgi:hypothetical protein
MAIGNHIGQMANCVTKEITLEEKAMAIGNIIGQTVNCGTKEITSMEKKMVCGCGMIAKQ